MVLTKKVLMLVIFLVLILSASATTSYKRIGYDNTDYKGGDSHFNGVDVESICNTDDLLCNTVSIQNSTYYPLVGDLDNDGRNEIVYRDGNTINVYTYFPSASTNKLKLNNSIALSSLTTQEYSNIILYDIDGNDNSNLEIILRERSGNVTIINFTNTLMARQSSVDTSASQINGESVLQCKGTNDCALFGFTLSVSGTGTHNFNVHWFNSSSGGSAGTAVNLGGGGSAKIACFPQVKSVTVADYDNDNVNEYITSFGDTTTPFSTQTLRWVAINMSTQGTVTTEKSITTTSQTPYAGTGAGGSVTCSSLGSRRYITSPLVSNIDGATGNGMEIAMAYSTDADEYQIDVWSSSGAFMDDFPEASESDGIIVSNMFLAKAHRDSSTDSFCVMGQDDGSAVGHANEFAITCGNMQSSEPSSLSQTLVYSYDVSSLYNISRAFNNYNIMTSAIQSKEDTFDGIDFHEILTTYGVFYLNPDDESSCNGDCNLLGDCCLNRIWENPKTQATMVSVDTVVSGSEDIIALQDNNLWYLDDGFVNEGADITSIVINPCLSSVWSINTTAEVTVIADDPDDDLVEYSVSLYNNTADTRTVNSGWVNDETEFPAQFIANRSVTSGTIKITVRDVTGSNTTVTETRSFSVSSTANGVSFGDCTTELDLTNTTGTSANESINDVELDADGNAITGTLRPFAEETGLPMKILWLLIMVIVGILLVYTAHKMKVSGSLALAVTALIEVGLMILGVQLGLLGMGIVVGIVVIAIAICVMVLRGIGTK